MIAAVIAETLNEMVIVACNWINNSSAWKWWICTNLKNKTMSNNFIYLAGLIGDADLDLEIDRDLETDRSKDLLQNEITWFTQISSMSKRHDNVARANITKSQYLLALFGLLLLLGLLLRLLERLLSYFLTCKIILLIMYNSPDNPSHTNSEIVLHSNIKWHMQRSFYRRRNKDKTNNKGARSFNMQKFVRSVAMITY